LFRPRAAGIFIGVRRPVDRAHGVAVFPREIAPPIRRFAEQTENIVHWTEFDRGGHFAAMEVPELLVGDVRECFRARRTEA
jgi:hypothetical protein